MGNRFDTSKGRGDFKTQIGVGQVIKGTCCPKANVNSRQPAKTHKAGMRG